MKILIRKRYSYQVRNRQSILSLTVVHYLVFLFLIKIRFLNNVFTFSRSRSRSPSEHKNNRYPPEIRRHIDYHLQDTNGLTEAELRDIPYTRVETAANIKTKYAGNSTGSKKHKSPKRSKRYVDGTYKLLK